LQKPCLTAQTGRRDKQLTHIVRVSLRYIYHSILHNLPSLLYFVLFNYNQYRAYVNEAKTEVTLFLNSTSFATQNSGKDEFVDQ
jgi:hypothetical protein